MEDLQEDARQNIFAKLHATLCFEMNSIQQIQAGCATISFFSLMKSSKLLVCADLELPAHCCALLLQHPIGYLQVVTLCFM